MANRLFLKLSTRRFVSLRWWKAVLTRAFKAVGDDRLALTAAGVAFYALLAIFPAMTALISLWSLFAEPSELTGEISALTNLLPTDVMSVVTEQAERIAGANEGVVGVAFVFSLCLAIFSASRGAKAVMQALNIVYDEPEERGFLRFNAEALLMTLALAVGIVAAIAAIAATPALFSAIGLGDAMASIIDYARWPILYLGAWAGIAALYRFAPSRTGAAWKWIAPGAGAAVVLWIIASALFSLYIQNFGRLNEVYGSLSAVVVLLLWFWVSAFAFLVGAELTAKIEEHS